MLENYRVDNYWSEDLLKYYAIVEWFHKQNHGLNMTFTTDNLQCYCEALSGKYG